MNPETTPKTVKEKAEKYRQWAAAVGRDYQIGSDDECAQWWDELLERMRLRSEAVAGRIPSTEVANSALPEYNPAIFNHDELLIWNHDGQRTMVKCLTGINHHGIGVLCSIKAGLRYRVSSELFHVQPEELQRPVRKEHGYGDTKALAEAFRDEIRSEFSAYPGADEYLTEFCALRDSVLAATCELILLYKYNGVEWRGGWNATVDYCLRKLEACRSSPPNPTSSGAGPSSSTPDSTSRAGA